MTIRIPNAAVFCDWTRTPLLKRGQAAAMGVQEKELQYRDVGDTVTAIAFETSGYVSEETYNFLSLLAKV